MTGFDIAVLTTGDELLSGELTDTNTNAIAELLTRHGYRLRCSLSVPDQEKEISAALTYLVAHSQVVIVTGGLGSTRDDLTARAAAKALRQPLVINDEALTMVHDWFRQRNRAMEPNNERQALLPQTARPLPNPYGTAPGFHLSYQNCDLFFLPGVPVEMKAMCEQSVLPLLQQKFPSVLPLRQRLYKIFGLAEPRIDSLIPYHELPEGVDVAFALDYPLVLLKLKTRGDNPDRLLDQAEMLIIRELGDVIMARDDEAPAANIGKLLTRAELTLALAESCTGGLLASLLTRYPGASAFLERGAVTYADSAKQAWLQVPPELIRQHGAVSQECARAMAQGLRRAAKTDLALAITGIAGPDGGTREKPVGTVYLGLSTPTGTHVKGYQFSGERDRIQLMSAYMALEWLRRYALRHLTGEAGI